MKLQFTRGLQPFHTSGFLIKRYAQKRNEKGGQRKQATFRVSMCPSINSTPVSPQLCSRQPAVAFPLIFPHSQSTQKILMTHPDFLPIVDILTPPIFQPISMSNLQLTIARHTLYLEQLLSHWAGSQKRYLPGNSKPLHSPNDKTWQQKPRNTTNIQQGQGHISGLQRLQMLRFHHKTINNSQNKCLPETTLQNTLKHAMQLKHKTTTSEWTSRQCQVLKVEMIKSLKKICENTNKQQN